MEVKIYSTQSCPYCQKAKEYFEDKGVKYIDYDVANDAEKAKEMVEKSGQMGVPVITIADEVIIGFDKNRLDTLLEAR